MKDRWEDGWGVAIFRENGTHFLCSAGVGDKPAIWCKQNRKWAVQHKRELIAEGFKAKVVPVRYKVDYEAQWAHEVAQAKKVKFT